MLLRFNAAVDMVTQIHTYIHTHTTHTHVQVRMLLRFNAAVDMVNDVGRTPLHACATKPIGTMYVYMHICMYVCACRYG